jgi:hypothetical protein
VAVIRAVYARRWFLTAHILPVFPVAEAAKGSWQCRASAAASGNSRRFLQGAQASSGDADCYHVPPFLLLP